MPWSAGTYSRAEGIYTGSTIWAQENAASIGIVDTRHDTHDQDLATGINSCLHKGGQNSPSANINWGGFKITNMANGSARSDSATVANIQDSALVWGGTSGGSANAHTLSLTPAITSYPAGLEIAFLAGFTNTGAATLNVNGVAATAIKKQNSTTDLFPGDIFAGMIVHVISDGTYWRLKELITNGVTTVTAAGTTQGTATLITHSNIIVSGTLHQGVVLPVAQAGQKVYVYSNAGTAPLLVYPASGCSFNGITANLPITILGGQELILVAISASTWGWMIGGGYPDTGITANGNILATATQIKASINTVTTVTAANNSVLLPHPFPGMQIVICNNDLADSLLVYPASGDIINNLGASNADTLTSGSFGQRGVYFGVSNTAWMAFKSS